jgi:hypothetical protein
MTRRAQAVAHMARRFRTILWQGAASAFLMGEPAFADPVEEVQNLPQWVVRAQRRLALKPAQQRELRMLVDDNAARMQSLPRQLRTDGMAGLQREFRGGLARILEPEQLAEWDILLEELLGAVHLRNAPTLAGHH